MGRFLRHIARNAGGRTSAHSSCCRSQSLALSSLRKTQRGTCVHPRISALRVRALPRRANLGQADRWPTYPFLWQMWGFSGMPGAPHKPGFWLVWVFSSQQQCKWVPHPFARRWRKGGTSDFPPSPPTRGQVARTTPSPNPENYSRVPRSSEA